MWHLFILPAFVSLLMYDKVIDLLWLFAVYAFRDENEAISAVSSRPESFHVAIVEVINEL